MNPIFNERFVQLLHSTTAEEAALLPKPSWLYSKAPYYLRTDKSCVGLENLGVILHNLPWKTKHASVLPLGGHAAIRLTESKNAHDSIALDADTQARLRGTALATRRAYDQVESRLKMTATIAGFIVIPLTASIASGAAATLVAKYPMLSLEAASNIAALGLAASSALVDHSGAIQTKTISEATIEAQNAVVPGAFAVRAYTLLKDRSAREFVRVDFSIYSPAREHLILDRCYYVRAP